MGQIILGDGHRDTGRFGRNLHDGIGDLAVELIAAIGRDDVQPIADIKERFQIYGAFLDGTPPFFLFLTSGI